MMNSYQKALDERKKQHLLRTLPLPPEGIDFYSNDYLGLAKSTDLSNTTKDQLKKIDLCENGSSGSRLLSGNSKYFESVEQKISDFHHAESALIYSSGYTANLGLISCLALKEVTLFTDELIHASLIDGARLGHSKKIRFKHNDVNDLALKLQKVEGQKFVIVESIYSMDGDVCPLSDMIKVCEKMDAQLIVDEAHSFAITGDKGEGLCQKLGIEEKILARIITYGKGAGIHGAAVVGPQWLKEYQINFSRPFIFSTAPSPHQFSSISAMYSIVENSSYRRDRLQKVIGYFMEKRKNSSANWLPSSTQIQSLIIPGNDQVIGLSQKLREIGINALPIRKPSVPEGAERIRFCLHSFNTEEEINLLFKFLNGVIPPLKGGGLVSAGKGDI